MKIRLVLLASISALLLLIVSCDPPPTIVLQNPMIGIENQDWTINNYFDLNQNIDGSNNGIIEDYMGTNLSYDGHKGTDFDVASFRQMDFGYLIRAAADGVVVGIAKPYYDRNFTDPCTSNYANYVTLKHDGGWKTKYLHLQKDNPLVNLGDTVQAGDIIGVVGSSGCSTQPHLHFEVIDPNGKAVCPFEQNLWATPPTYNGPTRVMDTVMVDGGFAEPRLPDGQELKDPPRYNDTTGGLNRLFGVGVHLGGGTGTETITMVIKRPDGSFYYNEDVEPVPPAAAPPRFYPHRWGSKNITPDQVGTWYFEVYRGGYPNGTQIAVETVQIN